MLLALSERLFACCMPNYRNPDSFKHVRLPYLKFIPSNLNVIGKDTNETCFAWFPEQCSLHDSHLTSYCESNCTYRRRARTHRTLRKILSILWNMLNDAWQLQEMSTANKKHMPYWQNIHNWNVLNLMVRFRPAIYLRVTWNFRSARLKRHVAGKWISTVIPYRFAHISWTSRRSQVASRGWLPLRNKNLLSLHCQLFTSNKLANYMIWISGSAAWIACPVCPWKEKQASSTRYVNAQLLDLEWRLSWVDAWWWHMMVFVSSSQVDWRNTRVDDEPSTGCFANPYRRG